MNSTAADKVRAQSLGEYFVSLGLIDCWKKEDDRITQKTGQNRLDRIMYRINDKYNESLQTDWTFTASDHCLLHLTLQKATKPLSRRIISHPTYILECKSDVEEIEKGMAELVAMCNNQWSASMKLEFLKTSLRTVVGECIKAKNKKDREELDQIQREIELKMVRRGTIPLHSLEQRKEEIDRCLYKEMPFLKGGVKP